VQRVFTADQNRTCTKISEQCLEHFNKNKTGFVRRFITMDETWIHHYTTESKQQLKQWIEAGCSAPKKASSVPSAQKFWDAGDIFLLIILKMVKQ
jgi:hypothetical protein